MKDTVAFIGRFQPLHTGHVQMIQEMISTNPGKSYVLITVQGEKSRLDTIRNPFPQDFISKTISSIFPDVNLMSVKTGYVPDIVDALKAMDQNLTTIYVGPDRFEKFKPQFKDLSTELKTLSTRYGPKENLSIKYAAKDLSGTIVRQMLEDNDYDDFIKSTQGYTEEDFNTMRTHVIEGKKKKIRADISTKLEKLLSKIETVKTENTRQKYLLQKQELESQLKEEGYSLADAISDAKHNTEITDESSGYQNDIDYFKQQIYDSLKIPHDMLFPK